MKYNAIGSRGRPLSAAALLLGTTLTAGMYSPAHAETLTVTDLVAPGTDLYKLEIPSVEVVDGNLAESDIRDLFKIGTAADMQKWATITASSVKIPEIRLTYSFPATATSKAIDETVIYRGIELRDVVDGVAASSLVESTEVEAADAFTLSFGEMTTGRFDIGATLAFYGMAGNTTASTEMKEIYDGFTFAGGSFSVADAVECTFGPATGGKFLARPLKMSLTDLEAIVLRVQEHETAGTTPSSDDLKTLVGYYTDLLTAFTSESMQFDGFDCSGSDPQTNGKVAVTGGEIKVDGFESGIYPDISLSDFNVDAGKDGFFKLGNFTWKKMDLNGPINALNGAETLDESWFLANWRALVPAMDGMSFSDVSFDLPDPESAGKRVVGTAGLFDISLDKYINGIPSAIALALDDATLPLPPELATGPNAPQLAARGITEIVSDTRVKLHWDEAQQAIIVDELLSDADDFFRVSIKGTLGNATPALFASNETEALGAAMGVTVKDLTFDLEDRGLYGLMLEVSAAESKQPLAATRTALSGMVQGMTLAILGSDEASLAAVGELGKFLSGDNSKVSITLTAKDGVGLTLDDLAALEKNPTALAGKVTVTATASGDPVPQPESAPAPETAPDATLEDQKRDLKTPAQQ